MYQLFCIHNPTHSYYIKLQIFPRSCPPLEFNRYSRLLTRMLPCGWAHVHPRRPDPINLLLSPAGYRPHMRRIGLSAYLSRFTRMDYNVSSDCIFTLCISRGVTSPPALLLTTCSLYGTLSLSSVSDVPIL